MGFAETADPTKLILSMIRTLKMKAKRQCGLFKSKMMAIQSKKMQLWRDSQNTWLFTVRFPINFVKNVRSIESEINEFFEGLQNLTEDEQIQELERQLDRILAQLETLSVQMKYKLETEILPHIKEQIEELRRRLEKIGKEDKLKLVDQKIQTISAKP